MTATVNQAGDVRRTLERTWNRLAKPGGEDPLPERWLDELAHAVEAQMPNGGQADDTAALRADVEQLRGALASAMAERNQFRIDCSQLADQLEAKQREVERLGRVHDELLGKIRDLEARQEELGRQNADALADREDLQELFDLQHRRMGAATELWRAEEPDERALVSPDLGALLEWLMERTAPATEPQHGHEHRHAWELDPESGLFVDCSCELPYPRDLVDVEDDELSPVAEPLDEFMLQLRQELEQVGFPSRLDAEPATELLVTDQHGAVYITPPPDEQTEPPVEREAKRSTRKVAECGTASGYARHRRDDEDACDACKAATARAKRERVAQRKAAAAGEVAG